MYWLNLAFHFAQGSKVNVQGSSANEQTLLTLHWFINRFLHNLNGSFNVIMIMTMKTFLFGVNKTTNIIVYQKKRELTTCKSHKTIRCRYRRPPKKEI